MFELCWARGGNWLQEEGVAYLLPRVSEDEEPEDFETRWLRQGLAFAATKFHEMPERWQSLVGMPAGLQRYDASHIVDELLTWIVGFVKEFRAGEMALKIVARQMGEREAAKLMAFLRTFGPLYPVPLLLEPVRAPVGARCRAVDLDELGLDLALIGELTLAVRDGDYAGREPLIRPRSAADDILTYGGDALKQVAVTPDVVSNQLRYQLHPGSLANLIWRRLLWHAGTGLSQTCIYCGKAFVASPGRGRRPDYCEAHRSARFRQRMRRRGGLVEPQIITLRED